MHSRRSDYHKVLTAASLHGLNELESGTDFTRTPEIQSAWEKIKNTASSAKGTTLTKNQDRKFGHAINTVLTGIEPYNESAYSDYTVQALTKLKNSLSNPFVRRHPTNTEPDTTTEYITDAIASTEMDTS